MENQNVMNIKEDIKPTGVEPGDISELEQERTITTVIKVLLYLHKSDMVVMITKRMIVIMTTLITPMSPTMAMCIRRVMAAIKSNADKIKATTTSIMIIILMFWLGFSSHLIECHY